MYSAHDTTMGSVLTGLNFTSTQCIIDKYLGKNITEKVCIDAYPHFASNIIFELWKRSDNSTYIKVKYNGNDMPICNKDNNICEYAEFK